MPTLELVCKRLFSDSSWLVKCAIGAVLLLVPIAHFFAFGYLYEMIARSRRGEPWDFPPWEDWRRLFANGVAAFILFLLLGVVPVLAAWVLTWPLRLMAYGVIVYLPLFPAIMLAGPLTAAGIYQYQKREDYRDALRIYVLGMMLRSSRARFWVPTFALVGFLVVGYPLMTFTIFIGLAASWSYYAAYFRMVEESRKQRPRPV
ncbi:MAG: DUF4013 domain-containing protein [Opitutaceae bacterium]|nr:DUF4013 domain-containing protein [Opitutaceae bacterium]